MASTSNYYEVLSIPRSADSHTLRRAFHRLSKELHPDTTVLPIDEAERRFHLLYEAYELLSDPLKRENYDKTLDCIERSRSNSEPSQVSLSKTFIKKRFEVAPRRPFSGSELLSLFLLGIALLISLLLGIVFALIDGRELQVRPSWLNVEQPPPVISTLKTRDAATPFAYNAFKSTFSGGT